MAEYVEKMTNSKR